MGLFRALGLPMTAPTYVSGTGWTHVDPTEVTLPAGTELRVERVYIRLGSYAAYNSITFRVTKSNPDPKLRGARFWAKLKDINGRLVFDLAGVAAATTAASAAATHEYTVEIKPTDPASYRSHGRYDMAELVAALSGPVAWASSGVDTVIVRVEETGPARARRKAQREVAAKLLAHLKGRTTVPAGTFGALSDYHAPWYVNVPTVRRATAYKVTRPVLDLRDGSPTRNTLLEPPPPKVKKVKVASSALRPTGTMHVMAVGAPVAATVGGFDPTSPL
jgi:hypothetical protein